MNRFCRRTNISRTFAYNRLGLCYEKIGNKAALSKLLRTDSYYGSIDTVYSIVSTVLWSLRTNAGLNDALLLSSASKLHSDPDRKKMIDCLTLLMSIGMKRSDRFYAEYRKLFLNDDYGVDALRIAEEYTIDAVVHKLSNCQFQNVDISIDMICNDIERGIPICLVRLGDGEVTFWHPRWFQIVCFFRSKIRRSLEIGSETASSTSMLTDGCRMISLKRYLMPTCSEYLQLQQIKYEATNEPRGYWGVYFAAYYAGTLVKKRKFVSPNVHLHLFRNERFLTAVRRAKAVNTISCHRELGRLLRGKFNVSSGVDLVVPGEMGSPAIPSGSKLGEHYPSTYTAIIEQISQFGPGRSFWSPPACAVKSTHMSRKKLGVSVSTLELSQII